MPVVKIKLFTGLVTISVKKKYMFIYIGFCKVPALKNGKRLDHNLFINRVSGRLMVIDR